MMKCPNCGNSLSDSAKFCPKCGAKMGDFAGPASGTTPSQSARPGQPPRGSQPMQPHGTQPVQPHGTQPVQRPVPSHGAQPSQPPRGVQPVQPPQYPQPTGKRSRAPLIIAIIAVVAVIGGVSAGATLFLVNRRQEKAGITSNVWGEDGGGQREKQTKPIAETSQAAMEPSTEIPTTVSPTVTQAPETAPAGTQAGVEGYILPDSSVRYLTDQDLTGLSSEQLRIARNEIYARHGRKFKDEALQAYFNGQPWYTGTVEPDRFNDDALLNDVERKNLELIKAREAVLN